MERHGSTPWVGIMDTTTIQTTEAQSQFLEDMDKGSKKAALQELIDSYNGDGESHNEAIAPDELAGLIVDEIGATAGGPQVDDSEIARKVARQLDYTAIADKVSDAVIRELRS